MFFRTISASAAAALVLSAVACSTTTSGNGASSSSGGSSGTTSSSGGSSSGGSSGTASSSGTVSDGPVSGTLAGKPFQTLSAVAHSGTGGTVDLIFSDAPDLCAGLKLQTFPAGVSIVQVYNLSGTAPGEFTPATGDVKYATLKDTCPSGASVNDHVAGSGDAKTTSVTIDSLTATRVAGELSVQFVDGSSVEGTFDIAMCDASEAENATCE